MKNYLASISLFALLIFLSVRLAVGQARVANDRREALVTAQEQLRQSRSTEQLKSLTLQARIGSDDSASFVRKYGGTLTQMRDLQSIAQRLGREAEQLMIPIQEQRTGTRALDASKAPGGSKAEAHEYTISIIGNFHLSLTWLGKVEDAFPFARVETVEITPAEDYISLRSTILFPVLDVSALEGAK